MLCCCIRHPLLGRACLTAVPAVADPIAAIARELARQRAVAHGIITRKQTLTARHVAALSNQRPALLGVARPAYFLGHERASYISAQRLASYASFM
jgi:hypothetical protein